MTDKPKLKVVSNTQDNTGTKTEPKQSRGKAYKGQPKTGSPKTAINSEGLTAKQECVLHRHPQWHGMERSISARPTTQRT
jgi:hypothetical protein